MFVLFFDSGLFELVLNMKNSSEKEPEREAHKEFKFEKFFKEAKTGDILKAGDVWVYVQKDGDDLILRKWIDEGE